MKITFDDYDRMQEQLEAIPNQSATWLPSEEELSTYVTNKPEKFLEFLIWLSLTVVPTTEDSKIRMRAIKQILYDKVIFLD